MAYPAVGIAVRHVAARRTREAAFRQTLASAEAELFAI